MDGVSVGAVSTYTFTNVTTTHTITASFSLSTNIITSNAGANGTISPSGATSVNYGANQTYTITPAATYYIANVLVDGVSVGAVSTYTFTNVTTTHTITASFSLSTNIITSNAGANGTISPSGLTSVNYGTNQTYTITPAATYYIANVLVDGVSVGAVSTYTFTNVTTTHTITASFSLSTNIITSNAGANGSITPSGATSVNYGSNQTYTITPAATYYIANVLVDGVSVGAVSTYTFTNVTTTHTITASFSLSTNIITSNAGANGTISPSGATSVNYGSNQSYTITPAATYYIANVLVDGVSVGAVSTYTFTNVTTTHTITASFSLSTNIITSNAGANGSITPSGATSVNYGSNQTYTITPAATYYIANVLVDGVSVGAVSTYTFTNVTTTHTIIASFSLSTNIITSNAGANGTISPSGATSVNYGSNQTYTITPAATYYIANVLVDGVSVGAVSTYTFTNVTTTHTITASFSLNTNVITSTAGANGTISPSGATSVNYGSNQSYTITPAATYYIANVLVDGVSVGAVSTYTFTNVTTTHTITASFSLSTNIITSNAGANGSITPSGATSVNYGSNQTYTITPAATYYIANVLVDGVSVGPVTAYTFTNVTTTHTITASFSLSTNIITSNAGAHGTISPSGLTSVNYGANQTYTITPAATYYIANVLVDGVSVGAVSTYTFTNVTTTHTITASFSLNTNVITSTAGDNGTISPSGATSVNYGSNQSYTITPAATYYIADVLVDGVSVGPVTAYTFTNVTTTHTITASFSLNTNVITSTAGANGTISPSGATSVNYGSNQSYTITPAATYYIADVLVDGVSVGPVTAYTFTNVTTTHTITASFSLNTNVITSTAGANGTISPSGATSVNYGSNQSYTITPDTAHGYNVADVLVDGVSVGAVTAYTFTNVTTPHTITASFSLSTNIITSNAGANGTISPSGATSVNYGASQSYTISPNPGYNVTDVLADGVSVGAVTAYTFTNVTQGHTITASFSLITYTVTFNSNGGTGTMSPEIHNAPTALTSNTFTRTGYTFAGWNTAAGGTGTAYADGASYSFAADITLYAQWTPVPTVTLTTPSAGPVAGGNNITISGTNFSNAGGDPTVTIGGNATTCTYTNSTTLACIAIPGHSVGAVNVVVTNNDGQSGTGVGIYTYQNVPKVTVVSPNSGPAGTAVTITGNNFTTEATKVYFGTAEQTSFSVSCDGTTITTTAPTGPTGQVDITVETPGGPSATSSSDQFTYG